MVSVVAGVLVFVDVVQMAPVSVVALLLVVVLAADAVPKESVAVV